MILTVTSRITKEEDVTDKNPVCRCKMHGMEARVCNVYTGKRKKFQGAIVRCPQSDNCGVYSYDAKDAAENWNKINFG